MNGAPPLVAVTGFAHSYSALVVSPPRYRVPLSDMVSPSELDGRVPTLRTLGWTAALYSACVCDARMSRSAAAGTAYKSYEDSGQ